MDSLAAGKMRTPTPTYMTDEQKASYFKELRSNRPSRPVGSRPAPFKVPHLGRSESAASIERGESGPTIRPSPGKGGGRPLVLSALSSGPRRPSVRGRIVSPTAAISTVSTAPCAYGEPATRRLEKEEAHKLRRALDLIDQRHEDEEQRIYEAAQAEAADLVWKHRNPHAAEDELTAPYMNPDLVKASRSAAARTGFDSSRGPVTEAPMVSKRGSRARDKGLSEALQELQVVSEATASINSAAKERRRSSGKRLASSGSGRAASALFRNPDDQIFEEPKAARGGEAAVTAIPASPLKDRSSNSAAVPREPRPLPPRKTLSTPAKKLPWLNRVEIHRNPPSQSRNAAYTSNDRPAPAVPKTDEPEDVVSTPKSSSSLEIRSDDIRAATTMMKKDRSPKLPTPVAVSDVLGRPIVSFDPGWKPREPSPRNSVDTNTHSRQGSRERPLSSHSQSAPVVPTISISDGDTTVPEINVPTILADDMDDASPSISVTAPPPPSTQPTARRPPPVHSATMPTPAKSSSSRPFWSLPTTTTATSVSCTACARPISGRIVAAAGSQASGASLKARFHPDCFRCAHCATRLEAVAFYPEPDEARRGRIEAAERADVAEADVRFYCHLDFHELFSPRCRSCKTPIEGAVVNACGHTYHQDHFFCAECGDPFASTTPFVEHRGYAYCVGCHTRRTSARCRGCRQVILDELTVEALGGKWHERCFVCDACGGDFGPDGRFFVRDVPVQPTDKERRRGIARKLEERAVCQACEEIRLKA